MYEIRTKTLRITRKEKESLEFLSTVKVIFVEYQRGRGGDIIGAANKDFLVLRKKGKILLSVFYIISSRKNWSTKAKCTLQ